MRKWLTSIFFLTAISGCNSVWNDPYPPPGQGKAVFYSAFAERPKHLDPAQSYSEDEAGFNAQIYEPPLQYHYLQRPYTLEPLTASRMPEANYYDARDRLLPPDADPGKIAYTVYTIRIRPGIYYQPHPAFAKNAQGEPFYRAANLSRIDTLADFKKTATRELEAADYVYEIKRLASPELNSPIFGLMSEYIVGLRDYAQTLRKREVPGQWLDLSAIDLPGVKVLDRHSYSIKIRGKYPQFLYWLAMGFFAPVPLEADRFYSQPGMRDKNLSLDWYPIGTGPYMMSENNPNSRMVLSRNPNFHDEYYPSKGEAADQKAGLLADAGKKLPFIDEVVYSREKETIPYWNKFLQGYYDVSGIASDSFDQAVAMGVQGEAQVSQKMAQQGIELKTSVSTSSRYLAFNMQDAVVGGDSGRSRLLRQAISIALDYEENISIFANGRGIPAQSPLPPGIFGHLEGEAGIDRSVYDWVGGAAQRKSIVEAKKLLAAAGYPDGRDAISGKPLVLYLDATGRGADDKTRFDWYRKEFARLNIQLEIRATDYNRFQEKVRKGAAQMFTWGWNADYPDPENFMFLLYGPQGKVRFGGENSANYSNPEYDALFEKMKNMENTPERLQIIGKMLEILRRDHPWVWGFHPKDYQLNHSWVKNLKPNQMARNNIKYLRIDSAARELGRSRWNKPVLWPFGLLLLAAAALIFPAYRIYRQKEKRTAK